MPPSGRVVTPTAVPCAVSPTDCSGSPASCCGGGCCLILTMTCGQRRSPEPSPKATRLDTLRPTKNSEHVAVHWSLISDRKSHQARCRADPLRACAKPSRGFCQGSRHCLGQPLADRARLWV